MVPKAGFPGLLSQELKHFAPVSVLALGDYLTNTIYFAAGRFWLLARRRRCTFLELLYTYYQVQQLTHESNILAS